MINTDGNGMVNIILPKELQSHFFADKFNEIQQVLSIKQSDICVNFENTIWVDHLPLLYLFVFLKKQYDKYMTPIQFVMSQDNHIEKIRFMKYLYDYGFTELMQEIGTFNSDNELAVVYETGNIRSLEKGDFKASECLVPVHFITKGGIGKYICEVCERIDIKIGMFLTKYEKEELLFKTSVFIQEVAGNVFEHAYVPEENPYCCLLIRMVHNYEEKNRWKVVREYPVFDEDTGVSKEFKLAKFKYTNYINIIKKNPYRNINAYQTMGMYLQIFVVDIGMGFLQSIDENIEPKKERELLNYIFSKGKRKLKQKRNTYIGGLGMLYQLLCNDGDYISVKGEYNWINIFCGLDRTRVDTLLYVHEQGLYETNILRGVSVIGNIGVRNVYKASNYTEIPRDYLKGFYENLTETEKDQERIQAVDYRFNNNMELMWESDKEIFLVFATPNMSKELWTNKIVQKLDGMDATQGINLIIVDIPEDESYKYEMIFDKMRTAVNKVILMTRHLSVAIYTLSETKRLHYSKAQNDRFIENTTTKSCIKSFMYLLNTIRSIESKEFWRTVVQEQTKNNIKLCLPGKVKWNFDDDSVMNGYLDFSQVSYNRPLRERLLYQLYRVYGYVKKDIYFEYMDRFTEDICEYINGNERILQGNAYQKVSLGSVYVTGTSSKNTKLIEEKENTELQFYFFNHPDSGANIKALLLWLLPSVCVKGFAEKSDEKNYERVGKTPYVAVGGNEYFASRHYDSEGSILLSPDATYNYLQVDSLWRNKFLKFGHFDLIDHHDYIFINTLVMFNKSRMENHKLEKYIDESLYDYHIYNLYNAVGMSEDKLEKSVKTDIQPEYQKVIKEKFAEKGVERDKGLFLYITDYETMEIISAAQNIFSDECMKRIMPIAPIIKKRVSSALLLSPILMDNISEKIEELKKANTSGKVDVAIFSATIASPERQREIKHILKKLGANEINSLSLVDRQRFPLGSREKSTYKAFCKIDLPGIGKQATCKLCVGIENIGDLEKKIIISDLRKRCEKIKYIWRSVKTTDNFFDAGVPARTINLPILIKGNIEAISSKYKLDNSIEITSDIALVIFSLENTAITLSIDFLKSCLEENLDDYTKILLIVAHLISFGEVEITQSDRYELAEELYRLLQGQKESNEYTSLASIVLLAQEKIFKNKLHRYYKEYFRRKHFMNVDFIVCNLGLMIAVDKQNRDQELFYWLKQDREEILYGIFLFTCSNCLSRHTTILVHLKEYGWTTSHHDFISAYNDSTFLEEAYKTLPITYFHEPDSSKEQKKEIIEKILKVKNHLKQIVASREDPNNSERIALAMEIVDMLNICNNFNKPLFKKVDNSMAIQFTQELRDIAGEVESEIAVSCNVKNIDCRHIVDDRWFYFTEDIRREIYYLMKDFRHAKSQEPIIKRGDKEYHGSLEIIFDDDYMIYQFKNNASSDLLIDRVKKQKSLKANRPSILTIKRLNRLASNISTKKEEFHFEFDENDKVFIAELRIPYLHIEKE